MPNWKKVILSGSNAHINNITASGHVSALDDSFTVNDHTSTELFVEGNITASGDIFAIGNVIAQQYIVSSSVTHMTQSFSSGSTIFGDTLDDTHLFTGSLLITGSTAITGPLTITGSLILSGSGNITASGDISASQGMTAGFYFIGDRKFATPSQNDPEGIDLGNQGDGNLFLKNLTASADISASGNLFALVANNDDTAFKTVMYDTSTGKFFRTGSYGGGGGGGSQQDLQDVTDNGEVTTNGGVFWSGQSYRWGGWAAQSALAGFQSQSSATPVAYTRVTPQKSEPNKWHLIGNQADPISQGKLSARNWLVFDPNLYVINSEIYNSNGAIGTDGSPGGIGGMVIENGGLQIKVDSASLEPAALSIVPGNEGPGIYFFERGGLTSEGSGSIHHNSASARLVFDTGSQAVKFYVGSTDETLKEVLFISKSGDNPRIGIGTDNPIRAFDFKEIRDDDRGGEILIRGSRTTKGADPGDEVGRVNFAIDSSSFGKVDTSGSAAEIVALVDDIDETGVQGSLSLRVASNKSEESIQRIKLIGNPNSPAIEFTGSAEFDTDVTATDLIINDFALLNAVRIGSTNVDPGDGKLYVEDYGTFVGGLKVGSSEDPGANNLIVDGNTTTNTFTTTGNVQLSGSYLQLPTLTTQATVEVANTILILDEGVVKQAAQTSMPYTRIADGVVPTDSKLLMFTGSGGTKEVNMANGITYNSTTGWLFSGAGTISSLSTDNFIATSVTTAHVTASGNISASGNIIGTINGGSF
jgi:hypothetical protein